MYSKYSRVTLHANGRNELFSATNPKFLALGKVELQTTILQMKVAVEVYTFCGAICINQLVASYCRYAVVPEINA